MSNGVDLTVITDPNMSLPMRRFDSNDDLPPKDLVLPPVLDRRPYDKESRG